MISPKLQESLEKGIHHKLNKYTGSYKGVIKTYFDGVNPVNEAEVTGTIRVLLDGRFIQHEYSSSFEGKPLEGIAIYGYNMKDKQYESAWMDTFHMGTGIMFATGNKEDVTSVTGTYTTGGPGTETWGWRTQIDQPDNDHLTITAWNIETGAEEVKAIEILYERV